MKILVTGGAGFIGSHLTDKLLKDGHQVVVLDNLANGKKENLKEAESTGRLTFIKGDITSFDDCMKSMEGVEIVYHLACLGVRHSIHSPYENHEVNAEGSLRILEAARLHQVKQFFYISTSEVYGKTNSFPIQETDITMPLTVYGSSKLAGENYTHSYRECYGLDAYVLRIFNNYGPRAHYEGDSGEIIPRSIVKIIYGTNPVIFGKGDVTRDFFFVKDTATVLASFLEKPPVERLMNIGTGVEYTMKELLQNLIDLMPSYKAEIEYADDRPADVPRLWVDNSIFKSMNALPTPKTMEEGLKETISFYEELAKGKNLLEEIVEKNWEK